MNREETNEMLRNSFNNILNRKLSGKELIREKEIKEIARKEKEEYEKKKTDFYNDPLHWDNNKRRRYHLPVLRGNVNKNRTKRYPSYHPSTRLFCRVEDAIKNVLMDSLSNNEFFDQFVDIKNIGVGNKNLFFCK